MKALILAAGYATRLYPLTQDRPKPLLPVAGKPIADYILDSISKVKEIDQVFVVTNAKFSDAFKKWADLLNRSNRYDKLQITIVNDKTTSNETRLGAIADIQFVIDEYQVNDDMLIIAGDNIFTFDFNEMVGMMRDLNHDVICGFVEEDTEKLHHTGVIELDKDQRVIGFEEKPENPKSNFACPAIYVYRKETLRLIKNYLNAGMNPDAPGHFIPWLIKQIPVYAYIMTVKMYDIGSLESYNQVRAAFGDYATL